MLQVEHLTKRYGAVTAVDDLSFEIESEGVYGFLGPNGAGKTTTMNIMTGCLSATQGTVRISGCDIYEEPRAAKRRVGYLPEQPPLYLGETPAEYLRFVGQAKGVRGERLRRQMEDVIEETGIGDMRNRRISALSKGYRQRVGIAQALLGEPDTVILDEPTVGLDPIQILEIRALIASLGKSRTVLISSHILSEVQNMCSKILIIAHGRLVAFDTPDALEARLAAPGEISLMAECGAADAKKLLDGVPGAASIAVELDTPQRARLTVAAGTGDIYALSGNIFRAFAAGGVTLCELGVKKASLEEIFLGLTEQQDGRMEGGGEK